MAMATTTSFTLVILCFFSSYVTISTSSSSDFLQCLSLHLPPQIVYTQDSSSYNSILVSSIRNPRFFTPTTPKPFTIITPTTASHLQSAVVCGKQHGVRIRVRSGGHDYEGLSYRSEQPQLFAVVDLANLRSVRVNERTGTAWVDSGAILGELYYAVAKSSGGRLGFPAGVCPTIGVGGHFSGGGFGMMMRKYGIAADNVIDATLVDANGRILNKKDMGKNLFWAIRGGGGESFGIVVSWKVRLVPVPETVTVFNIQRTLNQGAKDLVTKWQELAPSLPEELLIRVVVQQQEARFNSMFLGTCNELMPLMSKSFPDLGMKPEDCREMSWIQSIAYINSGNGDQPVEALLNRTTSLSTFSKNKSDYVKEPIPRNVWDKIWSWFLQDGAGLMILDPYGGKMGEIAESATPFPHRKGILYNIQYIAFWSQAADADKQMNWIRGLYDEMTPYVSKNPREAYVNYRDLDIGENVIVGNVTSYSHARVWGEKYFKSNLKRLAITKGMVDPEDYFRNEQSIPPLLP